MQFLKRLFFYENRLIKKMIHTNRRSTRLRLTATPRQAERNPAALDSYAAASGEKRRNTEEYGEIRREAER